MKLKAITRKRSARRRRVPSPKAHTTESFSLHYEDLHSARRFKPLHYVFIGIVFAILATGFTLALVTRHNSNASAEQQQTQEVR